jgi:NIMA (never in mitosis gene a)-related kinase
VSLHGRTLDVSRLHRSQTKQLVSEDKLKKWFAQMMIGLEYLHSRNILHRDLKSSNIFITKAGDLKIGDFGLAKVLAEGEVATSIVGTPNYMCPELFCEKPYGFKSDIWSLGCILYELTALRPAFSAFNMQGLIQKIKKVQFGPLSNSFSSDWTGTIKSMLKKSPEDRPMVGELMQHHFMGTSLKAAVERASALQLEEPESLKETFEEVHTENLSSKMNVQLNMDGDALKLAKPSRKEGLSSNLPPRRHSSQADVNHRPRTQQGAC